GEIRTVARQSLIPPLEDGFLSPVVHPANGTLFPQPRLVDGRLLDEAAGTGFRIFQPSQFLQGGEFEESEGVAGQWFERHGCTAAIVRPDHYVYGVAHGAAELDRQREAMAAALK